MMEFWLCLVSHQNEVLNCNLDIYFELTGKQLKVAFDLYNRHVSQSNILITTYDFAKETDGINNNMIPNLKPVRFTHHDCMLL